jgi:hypothetical protein
MRIGLVQQPEGFCVVADTVLPQFYERLAIFKWSHKFVVIRAAITHVNSMLQNLLVKLLSLLVEPSFLFLQKVGVPDQDASDLL